MKSLAQIADLLRERLKTMSITQRELCARACVARRTLTGVLSGQADYKVTTLLAVLDRLGCELVILPKAAAAGLGDDTSFEPTPPVVKTRVQAAIDKLHKGDAMTYDGTINARFLACVVAEPLLFVDGKALLDARLQAVLADFPLVEVVAFAGTQLPPDEAIPEPLRRRIIGSTLPVKHTTEVRFHEILTYLDALRLVGRAWIALDADATLYPRHSPGLLVCAGGFGEAEEVKLREMLATKQF
jgi:transcriptional regulator with XRE-family HTH domain